MCHQEVFRCCRGRDDPLGRVSLWVANALLVAEKLVVLKNFLTEARTRVWLVGVRGGVKKIAPLSQATTYAADWIVRHHVSLHKKVHSDASRE